MAKPTDVSTIDAFFTNLLWLDRLSSKFTDVVLPRAWFCLYETDNR
jgi:hypothetical protein